MISMLSHAIIYFYLAGVFPAFCCYARFWGGDETDGNVALLGALVGVLWFLAVPAILLCTLAVNTVRLIRR